jgi:hypothetical protein
MLERILLHIYQFSVGALISTGLTIFDLITLILDKETAIAQSVKRPEMGWTGEEMGFDSWMRKIFFPYLQRSGWL